MKTHHIFDGAGVSNVLPEILGMVMMDGDEVGSRQGERTKEILMPRIALSKPWQREVLVSSRKASIAAQIAETMWVLAGRNDVKWLSHYLPRAKDFSDDGTTWTGGYGPRIRKWTTDAWGPGQHIDQLDHVVNSLNGERGTRRAVINIYDPAIDTVGGKDVPCNNWLSFISRLGKLHMNVATRSNDAIWGWSGINQFEWSALQEIVAYLTGNQVGTLTFNVTSLHVYEKHWRKANTIIGSVRYPTDHLQDSPRFEAEHRTVTYLDNLIDAWFTIEIMIRNGDPAEFHVDSFPEPMMKSWLRVIQWYWSGDLKFLEPLAGARLHVAAEMSPPNKVLRQPDPPKGGDIKVPGTFPVADDGTVTMDVPPELRDKFTENALSEMSIVIGDPGELTDGHQVGDEITIVQTAPRVHVDWNDSSFSTRDKVAPLAWTTQFVEYVDKLHREKSAVYGDSWKRRGEQISILSNIARKIDRLGVGGAGDSSADTVIDLLVYLIKYRLWVNEQMDLGSQPGWDASENNAVRHVLNVEDRACPKVIQRKSLDLRIVSLQEAFSALERVVETEPTSAQSVASMNSLRSRAHIVDNMIRLAFPAARLLWGVEEGHLLSPEQSAKLFTVPLPEVTNATRRWAGYENEGENLD